MRTTTQSHSFDWEPTEHFSDAIPEGPLPLAPGQWLEIARKRAVRVALASEEELDAMYPTVEQVQEDVRSFNALAGVLEAQALSCRLDHLVPRIWADHQSMRDVAARLRLRVNPLH